MQLQVRSRWILRLTGPLLVLIVGLGCGDLQGMMAGGTGEELVAPAEDLLRAGDLPGAAKAYEALSTANPDSVDVAVGRAYVQLLQGDTAGADATLAAIETKAGEKVGEVKLRRALLAAETRNLDQVKEFGEASGMPEGKLLAAEAHLVDLDSEKAVALLEQIGAAEGVVGETASTYLRMLKSGDQHQAALAEASALWALGDRLQAVDSVEDSLKGLPEEDETKAAQILLWAGRAVTSGRQDIAQSLLDTTFPPPGQQWRYQATVAMVKIAQNTPESIEEGVTIFQQLAGSPDVPQDGVKDAIATACGVAKDPAVAKRIVEGMESAAVARCLLQAGAASDAAPRAPAGALKSFLENP